MENHSKQISIAASVQLEASSATTLCQNFITNFDNYKDVDAARQVLLEEFRNTQCYGTNFCGFVSPVGFMKITAKDNAICCCEFTEELCPIPPRGILAEATLWLPNISPEGTLNGPCGLLLKEVLSHLPYGLKSVQFLLGRLSLMVRSGTS